MIIQTEIAAIEGLLRGRKISVARLCRLANLAPTTWVRWKNGQSAQRTSYQRVLTALDEIVPDHASVAGNTLLTDVLKSAPETRAA